MLVAAINTGGHISGNVRDRVRALEQIDAALDANDLFSDDLQTQLQTLSVKARDVENQQENDAEILEGIQGTAISISMENGDDAMEYIDQLREALGETE